MNKYLKLLLLCPAMMSAQQQAAEYSWRYWFDSNSANLAEIKSPGEALNFEADATGLTEGLHVLNLMVGDGSGAWSGVKSCYFMRVAMPGTYTVQTLIDGEPYSTEQTTCGADGLLSLDFDASGLSNGLHALSAAVITTGGSMSSFRESLFMKVPTTAEISAMKLHYRIDGRTGGVADVNSGNGLAHIDLDLSSLSTGFHSMTAFMSDGRALHTQIRTTYFIKLPDMGGAINEYRYWVNDDRDNQAAVKLEEPEAQFKLVDMLDIPEVDFRSLTFGCAPQADGSLTLTAQNTMNMLFLGEGGAILNSAADYLDPRTTRSVTADEITELSAGYNAATELKRPAENGIHWFSCNVEPGGLLTLVADRPCMIDVFDQQGEKVYNASGAGSTTTGRIDTRKGGVYYVAVHDFAPSAQTLHLTHTLLNGYALATWTPDSTATRGTMFVDMYGNGLDELKQVKLRSGDYAIESSFIGSTDHYNAMARFDLDGKNAPKGLYDIEAEFVDSVSHESKTVMMAGAIKLVEPNEILIETRIEPSHRPYTPYEVEIKVENKSNVPCTFVPVNIGMCTTSRGYTISFKNFYLQGLNTELQDKLMRIIKTDNLLGTGNEGYFIPTVIPYIGAYETVTLTIGITSEPHERIRMYAWNGEPWSEELKRLCADTYEYTQEDFEQTNMLSMTKIVIMQFAEWLKTHEPETNPAAAPVCVSGGPLKVNTSTWGDDAVNAVSQTINHPNYAGTAADLARANGKAIGGIFNGLRMNGLKAFEDMGAYDPSDNTFSSVNDYGDKLRQGMPNPGEIVATAFGEEDNYDRLTNYVNGGSDCNNPMPDPTDIDCLQSGDPNDMTGYTSPSGSNHIGINVKELPYTIEFENDPEIANASAMTIEVTNTLDASRFDLNSFVPGQLRIGSKTMELPSEHHFVKTLDMRPEVNAIAELTFDYEATAGKATWKLRSLDPMTMDDAEYREQGILPVNENDHRGEGHVTYTIGLKQGLAHDTKISNKASIVFDTNKPIETPEWVNITDYVLPEAKLISSAIDATDSKTYDFTTQGTDTGAGVWRYELYGMPPGSRQWRLLGDWNDTDFTYHGQVALTGWRFTALAIDGAGNRQDNKFMSMEFGDVNMSGKVDAHDVVLLIGYYVGQKVEIEQRLADINGDNRIDAQDAVMAQTKYVQPNKSKARQRKYPKEK